MHTRGLALLLGQWQHPQRGRQLHCQWHATVTTTLGTTFIKPWHKLLKRYTPPKQKKQKQSESFVVSKWVSSTPGQLQHINTAPSTCTLSILYNDTLTACSTEGLSVKQSSMLDWFYLDGDCCMRVGLGGWATNAILIMIASASPTGAHKL